MNSRTIIAGLAAILMAAAVEAQDSPAGVGADVASMCSDKRATFLAAGRDVRSDGQ